MDEPGVICPAIRIAPALALRGSIVRIWRGVGGRRYAHGSACGTGCWRFCSCMRGFRLRTHCAANKHFNANRPRSDRGRWRCDPPIRKPREPAECFWKGRFIRAHSTGGFCHNPICRDAGREGRFVTERRHYTIRRHNDEQHRTTRFDTRKRRLHSVFRVTQTSATQPTIPIIVDWKTTPAVPALGKTIVIESASPTALIYRIEGP
jgi:hypothetical protein